MQRNGTDDLAGSYIEVSLDAQHLWLYKDGGLVTETDIVSGAPTEERHTYTGAWPIAYKASPFTLTSDAYGYDIKVKYWMPFVYGQGLHDAPCSRLLEETVIRQETEVMDVSICRKKRLQLFMKILTVDIPLLYIKNSLIQNTTGGTG